MAVSFEDCIRCLKVYRKILREINTIEREREYMPIRWEVTKVIMKGLDTLREIGCLSGPAHEKLYEDVIRGTFSTLPYAIEEEILNACRSAGSCQGKH